MPLRLEEYALLGDCQTAALVGLDGSIDWLCLPRFDSAACFAALLGTPEHGRWLLAPEGGVTSVRRHYRDGTLVLETDYVTRDVAVTVIDCMPLRSGQADVVRVVQGREGRVPMRMELVLRLDYGAIIPWVQRVDGALNAIAGPDQLRLVGDVPVDEEGTAMTSRFAVAAGERVSFDLTWSPSHLPPPPRLDTSRAIEETERFWTEWSARCTYQGPWRDAVLRSLVTLKALTYAPTGGIVAAATTSLPAQPGGVRNWDYRYCWLRDATFTLLALMSAGYVDEARAWREWLLRAVAGRPSQMRIMYGLAGERRLPELELPWLPGYEGAAPVRVGNGASSQHQLDVYGEVMDTMYQCLKAGLGPGPEGWRLERELVGFLESVWSEPDEGIWEVRGPRRHFTYSKIMAWVALDRAVKSVESYGLDGPIERWRALRSQIHAQVCRQGYDPQRGAFVQSYGSKRLDASLLTIPLVGFLPVTDPRVRGTIEAIEHELTEDGFVSRYKTHPEVDGLPPGEGSFLLCTFWLADDLALLGRRDDATRLFERLLAIRSDVGLLSEGYHVEAGRLVGNYPQAFSHIGLINTALNLSRTGPTAANARGSRAQP